MNTTPLPEPDSYSWPSYSPEAVRAMLAAQADKIARMNAILEAEYGANWEDWADGRKRKNLIEDVGRALGRVTDDGKCFISYDEIRFKPHESCVEFWCDGKHISTITSDRDIAKGDSLTLTGLSGEIEVNLR